MHNQKKDNDNLKTKNNQNCQKVELYGSPTTKELKKKHSSRLVDGVETGSGVDRTHGKAAAGWKTGVGKAAAGGPDEVVDCGVGWARLQLASKVVAGRVGSPTFVCR